MGEPIEAEFQSALSKEQEEQFRQLDIEGPLHRPGTNIPDDEKTVSERPPSLNELEKSFTKQGLHIVTFEPGACEDPREWGLGWKW